MRFSVALCGFLVLFGVAASLGGCKKQEASDAATSEAQPPASAAMAVAMTTVQRQSMKRGIRASGPVSAVEEMLLGVELSGLRVTALNVEVGETVKQGDVLLTLDHRTLNANLAQAKAALREAKAAAEFARTQLVRGENLAKKNFISAMRLDEMRAARVQSQARVATAQAAYQAASLQRSFAELRAPADGVISKRTVQAGQVVGAGMELMRLIRDGQLEWRADLPASQLATVTPGDAVVLDALSGSQVHGVVRAVSPGVDAASRTGTVFADLPNPQGLRLGTYMNGHIHTGAEDALVLPMSAIVMRDGFATVFALEANGTVTARRVVQGTRQGGLTEITSGVDEGTEVVTEGAGFLADGDAVRVVPATETNTSAQP